VTVTGTVTVTVRTRDSRLPGAEPASVLPSEAIQPLRAARARRVPGPVNVMDRASYTSEWQCLDHHC
jgi:hypothetical protein